MRFGGSEEEDSGWFVGRRKDSTAYYYQGEYCISENST
jgi:hypothetical protein